MLIAAVLVLTAFSDVDLTTTLTSRLYTDPYYYPQELSIQVNQGIATLAGAARNPRAKARAIEDAESTRGIRGVIDRILVTPPAVPDRVLEKDVASALKMDPGTSAYSLTVTVHDADVMLKGKLKSKAESELAIWVAAGVDGVRSVRSQARLPSRAIPPDPELARAVAAKLRRDVTLYHAPIEVKARHGEVFLIGRVDGPAAWRRAAELAWSVGPADVNTAGIQIAPELPGARPDVAAESAAFHLPDADIWDAVTSALRNDPRTLPPEPVVAVKDGVVTLSGPLASLIEAKSVVEDATHVRGVLGVSDKLVVTQNPALTDAVIAAAIHQSIALHSPELQYRIGVAITRGNVALSGVVSSAYQKALAWDAVARVAGVRSIRDEIQTNPAHPTSLANELGDSIRETLASDALLNPINSIKVAVNGLHAQLEGSVVSSADRDRACKDALESGATEVIEDLSIALDSGHLLHRGPTSCT